MRSLWPFGRNRQSRGTQSTRRRSLPLTLETLEDRVTPAVFNVNSLADILNPGPGVVTLRSAIQQANQTPGGNTINLTVAGTYQTTLVGTPGETDNAAGEFSILATGGNLTIQNTSGGQVTLDGGGRNRVLDINANFDPANPPAPYLVTLQGVTIQNGLAIDAANPDGPNASGGGIRDTGNASLTLNDVLVTKNNASADGGGIVMENVVSTPWTLTLNNSVVSNNHAGDAGGGIDVDGSGKVFLNAGSALTGNTALNQGAGIWLDAIQNGADFQTANLTVTGTTISDNAALASLGGGIGNAGNGTVTIVNSTVTNNFAATTGGGFGDENGQGTLVVQNSLFTGNSAANSGGGIATAGPLTTITNTEFKDNSSGGNGGAVFATGTTLKVLDSTFAGNTAAGNGGAFEIETTGVGNASSNLINTTITGNSALNSGGGNIGGGIDFGNAGPYTGTTLLLNDTIHANYAFSGGGVAMAKGGFVFVENTILAGNQVTGESPDYINTNGTVFTSLGGNLIGNNNNGERIFTQATDQNGIATAQVLALLGPLQNNGGPTVGAPGATLALETEALLPGSAAINKGVPNSITSTDERGFLRVVGTAVDDGAVEFQPGATTTTLTSNHATIIQGQPVVLTAHVAPQSAAPNNLLTGSVVFTDGGLTLGTATLDANGNASITVTNLPLGQSSVVATYTPDAIALAAGFATSSAALPETVNAANIKPVLTLTTSIVTVTTTTPGALTFTQTVTIMLKVAPPAGVTAIPTGTVTFFDGNLALNAAPVALDATGTATLQLTGLPGGAALVGGQSLTAVYTPDATGTANGFVAATSGATVLTVGTPAELVLNQLFKDLLNRPVNQMDLSFWVPQLGDQANPASGAAQQAVRNVTLGILQSDAFRMQEITWLFINYLGRTPNQNDLNFWLPNFRNGMTIEQAATIFLTSPEFIAKNGGTSDGTVNGVPSAQLVTVLFQDALGRTPSQAELQFVQGHSLQQVVSTIFNSPEYHGHLVDVFYQDFLRRRAQGGEDQFWVNFFPGGPGANQVPSGVQPDVFILSGFIGSQEYIAEALANPLGQPPIPTNPLQASIT